MDLRKHKKSETNHDVILQDFAEIKFKYADFSTIYTDGSKDDTRVAAAAVLGTESATCSLPSDASIFTSVVKAINFALEVRSKDIVINYIRYLLRFPTCLLFYSKFKVKKWVPGSVYLW